MCFFKPKMFGNGILPSFLHTLSLSLMQTKDTNFTKNCVSQWVVFFEIAKLLIHCGDPSRFYEYSSLEKIPKGHFKWLYGGGTDKI